jgi:hypothetical protein
VPGQLVRPLLERRSGAGAALCTELRAPRLEPGGHLAQAAPPAPRAADAHAAGVCARPTGAEARPRGPRQLSAAPRRHVRRGLAHDAPGGLRAGAECAPGARPLDRRPPVRCGATRATGCISSHRPLDLTPVPVRPRPIPFEHADRLVRGADRLGDPALRSALLAQPTYLRTEALLDRAAARAPLAERVTPVARV